MSSLNPRLTLSPEAQQDLIGILRYTGERWGLEQLAFNQRQAERHLVVD